MMIEQSKVIQADSYKRVVWPHRFLREIECSFGCLHGSIILTRPEQCPGLLVQPLPLAVLCLGESACKAEKQG